MKLCVRNLNKCSNRFPFKCDTEIHSIQIEHISMYVSVFVEWIFPIEFMFCYQYIYGRMSFNGFFVERIRCGPILTNIKWRIDIYHAYDSHLKFTLWKLYKGANCLVFWKRSITRQVWSFCEVVEIVIGFNRHVDGCE